MKLFVWEVMKKLESLAAVAVKVNKLVFNENKGARMIINKTYKRWWSDVIGNMSAIVVYLAERPP